MSSESHPVQKPDFAPELQARFVLSGVLVFKDKDGNVVAERPFTTNLPTEADNGDQRSQ